MSASPLSRIGLSSAAGDDGDPSPGSSRKAVLGVAALATVGLALGASVLLGGGDDLDDLGGLGVVPAAAAATPAAPSPTPSVRFPDADQVQDGRNPFQALYVEPAPGAGPPAVGAPATGELLVPGATTGGGAAAPAAPAAPGPVGPAVPPVEPVTGAPASGAVLLALLRTEGSDAARTAVFTVDGAVQAVAVGEGFGPDGSLLLLSLQQGPDTGGWTAVVQRGQGDPFDVVTGTPVPLP